MRTEGVTLNCQGTAQPGDISHPKLRESAAILFLLLSTGSSQGERVPAHAALLQTPLPHRALL